MRRKTLVYLFLGLILGLVVFIFPIVGFDFTYFPGDLGDGRLNLYFLEHCHRFFIGKVDSFWDAPFMYPEPAILTYSDNLIGSAPFYSFFRFLGLGTFASYQCWFITVSGLNFIGAFLLLNHVTKSPQAAVIGAFIFAFSIALQSQLTHAQTFPRFAVPLSFLYAVQFRESGRPFFLGLSLFALSYQFACGVYLGFLLALPLGIFLGFSVLQIQFSDKISTNRSWYLKLAGAGTVFVLSMLPILLPYSGRSTQPSLEHFLEVFDTIPSLKSYLFSHGSSRSWESLNGISNNFTHFYDHQIFPGGIALLAFLLIFTYVIIDIIRNRPQISQINVASSLIFVGTITWVLYLRMGEFTLYKLLYFLPGFNSMRSMARIINIELVFFALAVSYTLCLLQTRYARAKNALFAIALLGLLFDNSFNSDKLYRTAIREAEERSKKIAAAYSNIPAESVVSYEPKSLESNAIFYNIDAMLQSQKKGHYSINGYTATSPKNYHFFWNEPNATNRNIWLKGKEIKQEYLYVVNEFNEVDSVPINSLPSASKDGLRENKIRGYIRSIQADSLWLKKVEVKAFQQNIPLDSMLRLDAIWMIENE